MTCIFRLLHHCCRQYAAERLVISNYDLSVEFTCLIDEPPLRFIGWGSVFFSFSQGAGEKDWCKLMPMNK